MGSCLLARLQQRCIFVETVKNDFRLNVSINEHKSIRLRFFLDIKCDFVLLFEDMKNSLFHSGRLFDQRNRCHFAGAFLFVVVMDIQFRDVAQELNLQ